MAKQTFTTGQVLTAAQMTSLQQTAMGGGSTTAKTASYVLVAADAGTVVQMNSASATTITVNTALFAAGDTVEIQNVGAGVCTVTAGTATVSTSSTLALKQYDAGSLYFNTTSAALFFAVDAADSTSPLTTKGDLYTFSTTDARLAVGANGETLVADSSTATGLRYQGNFAAGKNKMINGDFNIWQRGTTSSGNGYLADRWFMTYSVAPTTFTQSRQTFTPGTAPVAGYESRYFWRYAITTVGSNTDMYIGQLIEDVTTFAGQTMTFSIYLKADSARSVSLSYNQNFGSGGSSAVSAQVATYSVTTAWTRFSTTISIPSIAGKTIGTSSYLQFFLTATPASGFSLDCWGVQAEAGSVATAFQTATGTLQGELAACQRYFYKTYPQSVTPGTATNYIGSATGTALTTAAMITPVRYAVTMRTTPTITIYHQDGSVNKVYYILTGAQVTVTGAAYASDGGFWQIDAATTLVAGAVYYWHYTASAEL